MIVYKVMHKPIYNSVYKVMHKPIFDSVYNVIHKPIFDSLYIYNYVNVILYNSIH